MNSSANGSVVLAWDDALYEGIGLILSQWTAMRAAVDNGWGGPDSREKAEGTVSDVFDYLTLSKVPVESDKLVEILVYGLNELNTDAQDGSVPQVTDKLLDLYEACLDGNYKILEELRLNSSQTKARVVKVSNGNDEESDDEDEDTSMNNDQTTDMMVDASEHTSNRKPEAMPVDEPTADDGWTVVPCRKNKGKRN